MDRKARLRFVVNLVVGTVALAAAVVLIKPRVIALLDGSFEAIGVGAVANLALVFGGLMFLREAQRAYGDALARPSEESKPSGAPGSLVE